MKIKGKAAELLVKTNPSSYQKFVITKTWIMMLHVLLRRTLYGQLKVVSLLYEKFMRDQQDIGFILNPYDPGLANCMINK